MSRSSHSLPEGATHALCETYNQPHYVDWHIRKLSEEGPKFGGGADTLALCGRQPAWDMNLELTEKRVSDACPGCSELYEKEAP